MKHKRLAALLIAAMMLLSCALAEPDGAPAADTPAASSAATPTPDPTPTPTPDPTPSPTPEPTATPTPEPTASPTPEPTATPTPEPTATPTPEPTASPTPEPTATPTPEPTASPTPEPTDATASPEPTDATASPEPTDATASPEPTDATASPEPTDATASPEPTDTTEPTDSPRPDYPRAVLFPAEVIVDARDAAQGGALIVALPIAYETQAGAIVRSNEPGPLSGWTPTSPDHPGYFKQDILSLPFSPEWTLDSADSAALSALFDMSGGEDRIMVSYAPKENEWGMEPGAPFNTGYAVFILPILPDAPIGRHRLRFLYKPEEGLMNREDIEFFVEFGVSAPSPTATDEPEPTDGPGPTDEPGPTDGPEPLGEGNVMIGQMSVPTLKMGQTNVTMAIPVSYADDVARVYSNRSDEGEMLPPGSEDFSQEILDYIEWLEVEISDETAADSSFPFTLSEQGVRRTVIADGVNHGYAVFSGLTVKKGLSNGTAAVPFTVHYIDVFSGEPQTTELTALVTLTGASSGYGGGSYGGGGGYASPTTAPQARVIVESIATDPAEVKAGDTFDLVMSLRNTSPKQYVQNMAVTVNAEEETLVPLTGSNKLYIPRIEADSVYELRYPVRANLEVPDRPLRVDVTIEYEDASVSAQSAIQQLIVNVSQKMRLMIEEQAPQDASALYAGSSADLSLQIVNKGRTMLYNVTVTPQSEDDRLILPASAYPGNMEGGSSRKAELSVIPTQAGEYSVTLEVTWENAMGEKFSDQRVVSFTAQAEELDDYWNTPYTTPEPDYEFENEGPDIATVLEMLPWWIYAGAAGLYLLIVVYIALSVRARRRKALEDEEDEIE